MKKRLFMGATMALFTITAGLPLTATAGGYGHDSTLQAENSYYFDFSPTNGAMVMTRHRNGVRTSIAANGLGAGEVYTVWWVIWNDPSQCNNACGDEDIDFGVPGNAVIYAGGFLADANGSANVSVSLKAGHPPKGTDYVIPGGLKKGNGLRAEIHVVLRTHGGPIPGLVAEQIGTYNGGCDQAHCEDQQFSVFLPPKKHHY